MQRHCLCKLLITILLLLLPSLVSSQEIYKFERMWPTLKQPWYYIVSGIAVDSHGFMYITDVDILMKVYKKLSEKDKKISLVCIGGYKSDEHYQLGIDSGAIMIERCNKETLLKYYQAADINVYPVFNKLIVNSGGFGTANIEALACGVPFLSNNIIHFNGTEEERNKIGMEIGDESALENKIKDMLENLDRYKTCREVARKYLDVNKLMELYLEKYDELFDKYYT